MSPKGKLNNSQGVILIVDDNTESLGMLNEALVKAGYTVLLAIDGQQALNITERITPDLVLMDAMMPNMDGFDACRTIKQDPEMEDIPVIFMTGLSDSEDVLRGLQSGGVDYVVKPLNLDILLARLSIHLGNARKARSARGALNEMDQPAFACDAIGSLLWTTDRTKEVLNQFDCSLAQFQKSFAEQLEHWLADHPERHAMVKLMLNERSMQIRFLGMPSPGEFLLRLVDDDELSLRQALRKKFELTEREAEVLFWLSRGKTNQEISQILSMSPRTVHKHLETVFRKMEVENRTSAAAATINYLATL